MVRSGPEITVLLPLFDPRGDPVERLRAWTRGQDCPRHRYQIAIATPGDDAGMEARLAAELAPQDRLVHAELPTCAGLYDRCLAVATAPFVLLTEMHTQPDPACLTALLDYVREHPESAGAAPTLGHLGGGRTARLEQLRYRTFADAWNAKDHWYKVRLRGTLLRTDVLRKLGGFVPEIAGFCDQDLSALFAHAGYEIGRCPAARIDHDDRKGQQSQAVDVANFVLGELASRERRDPDLCERYFGPRLEWDERAFAVPELAGQVRRALASSLVRTVADPRRWRWLPSLSAEALRHGVGPSWRARGARLSWVFHSQLARFGFGDRFLTHHYERAAEWLAHALRLEWTARRSPAALLGPVPTGATLAVHDAFSSRIVGFHGRERGDAGPGFRWSGPAALLRLRVPAAASRVTVSLEPLRPRVASLPLGVFWNGVRVADAARSDQAIRFEVGADRFRTGDGPASEQWLLLVCPKLPRSGSRAEPRRLGLAVRSVTVEPVSPRDAA